MMSGRQPVHLRVRREPAREVRHRHDGDHQSTLPNAESRPRRLTITADDVVCYADYSRGYLGMYNPKTGASKEMAVAERPEVAAMRHRQVNGVIWYSESAIRPNTLVRFDPKTEKFQSWIIPGGGGGRSAT